MNVRKIIEEAHAAVLAGAGAPEVIKVTTPTVRNGRVKMECMECGRKFSVAASAADPECPRCGGTDWEVL